MKLKCPHCCGAIDLGETGQRGVTPRQTDVINAIVAYRAAHDYGPTLQELADLLGVCKNTIYSHVEELERKRRVTRTKQASRSLAVVPTAVTEVAHAHA